MLDGIDGHFFGETETDEIAVFQPGPGFTDVALLELF
jgi:hypothetical protein